jgi:hypothetical protein
MIMDAEGTTTREASLPHLIRELRDEATLLFRQEIQLARTEATEIARQVGKNVAALAIGGAIAFAGALVLLAALSILVSVGLRAADVSPATASWLGPGLVGLVVTLIGAGLLLKARSALKKTNLTPTETVASLKEDKEWTQEKLRRR